MANVTYSFTAGTKAVAEQVNTNFTDCINAINLNTSSIETINGQLENLENSSANVNGNSSERFSVADPVLNSDAVNKNYLRNWTSPSRELIDGLSIHKVSDTEVTVTSGSCLDNTHLEILELSSDTTASFEGTQQASTQYDVYITKNKTSQAIEIDVKASGSMPDGDIYYYRNIGFFYTNSDNVIQFTQSYTYDINSQTIPDYTKGVNKTANTTYTAEVDGLVYIHGGGGVKNASKNIGITINNIIIEIASGVMSYGETGGDMYWSGTYKVSKGDTYLGWGSVITFKFFPLKGA